MMSTLNNETEFDRDDGKTLVDVNLFKAIGLYQLLRPLSGDRYRTVALAVLWLSTAMQCMQIVRLYLVVEDIQQFPYTVMLTTSGLICMFKGYVLVTRSREVWVLLDATRYTFTSCGRRDPSRLHSIRHALSRWLRTFAVLGLGTMSIWTLAPWFLGGHVSFVKLDGTVGHYRTSIYNFWYPVSEMGYNWTPIWAAIYVIEAIICYTSVFAMVHFDCFLVTMCFALNAQFHTMSVSYEELGHSNHQIQPSGNDIYNEHKRLEYYKNLIHLIKDNQKIIKKYEEFFNIIRPVVLVQIVVNSYTIITLIFFIVLGYITGLSMVSAPMLKLCSAYSSITFELFIYCYVFNLLESAKSTLNFGLYSSNWTEMDLKFQKTLLMAMNLNSAYMRVMRVSPIYIVNLEMFARVMKMSFSIVSVLINTSTN